MQEGLKREMEKAQAAHMQVLNNRKAKNERRRLRMEAYEEQIRRNHHVNIEEPRLVMMKGSQDRGEMEARVPAPQPRPGFRAENVITTEN